MLSAPTRVQSESPSSPTMRHSRALERPRSSAASPNMGVYDDDDDDMRVDGHEDEEEEEIGQVRDASLIPARSPIERHSALPSPLARQIARAKTLWTFVGVC